MPGAPQTETQSLLGPHGAEEALDGFLELRVVVGPDPLAAPRVLDGPVVVGRRGGEGLDLAFEDPRLSRRHARFVRGGDGWTVEDLRSKNGTSVDGVRVELAELRPGSVVRVGDTVMVVAEVDGGTPGPRTIATRRTRLLFHELSRLAASAVPVLLLGETGCGKEVAARFVHEHSGRRGRFVAVNCAAVPRELAEATFFGHLKGAFTGAAGDARGLLAAADGGTLFFDEVGDLPADLQPKLLRVLDGGGWLPVGSDREQRADLRVVSATNRDLSGAVAEGTFRRDLYARLAGHVVPLPPLRERRPDIPGIARTFLFAQGRSEPAWTPDLVEALLLHDWPMNVRELEAVIRRAVVLAAGAPLDVSHLPADLGARRVAPADPRPDPDALRGLLERHRGNVSAVAAELGKERRQVYRWLERAGLDPGEFR